jgi:hypothetical protein
MQMKEEKSSFVNSLGIYYIETFKKSTLITYVVENHGTPSRVAHEVWCLGDFGGNPATRFGTHDVPMYGPS